MPESIRQLNDVSYDIKPIYIRNILGKEIKQKRNTPLFYIYDDGAVEKKIIIE